MKKSLFLVLIVLAAMLAFAGCSSDDATTDGDTDGDTPDGDTPDGDNPDGDTPDGDTPDGDTPDGDTDGDTPDGDEDGDTDGDQPDGDEGCGNPCENNDDCSEDCSCHDTTKICTETECDVPADCADLYGEGCWVCDGEDYLCYPQACAADADCCTGTACLAGVCQVVEACPTDASYIMVTPGGGLIAEGETVTLTAALFNENGMRLPLLGDNNFTWASSDDTAVAVAAGVLTGGTNSAAATITVTLACNTAITATVDYQNFAALTTGSRVVVMDSDTGALLSDVPVFLNGTEVATVSGVAEFAAVDCATDGCDLHVFPATHTYVSAFGLGVNDILIPVAPNVNTRLAGGVKGHQDPSAIPEILQGDVRLGLSLFSIPGNLADLNFESLIGELVNTHVQIGATIDEWITLPSGLEGYLNETTVLKDGYQAQGIGGKGTLWGLGGYAELTELIELVTGNLEGDIEVGPIVAAILPLFENFYHGIMTGLEFTEIAKIKDVDDINANEDTTDYVPDFANFVDLADDFALTQAQTQSAEITFGDLPAMGDGCADSIVTLVGAMETGVGFIPLGLNVALDELEDTTDCKVGANSDGKVNAVFAPQHSGVAGYDYYVVSIALSINSLLGKVDSVDLSGSVYISTEGSPSTVAMPAFLDFMSDATWNSSTHTAAATAVTGATLHRIVFSKKYEETDSGEQRYWHIYWAGDASGASFTLPASITDDRSVNFSSASLAQAIKLNSVDYNALFGFNGTNIDNMNPFMDSFSMHAITDSASATK